MVDEGMGGPPLTNAAVTYEMVVAKTGVAKKSACGPLLLSKLERQQ
jgi:hypothetical protein